METILGIEYTDLQKCINVIIINNGSSPRHGTYSEEIPMFGDLTTGL